MPLKKEKVMAKKCRVVWSPYSHSMRALVIGPGGKILKTASYGHQISSKQRDAEARKLKRKFCR